MAINPAHWSVTRSNGNIRYIGDDHDGASPSYATVIELHRWLQDKADDASSSGDDQLDITDEDPSRRSTDNIITLLGNYNIDDTAAEHLYDGSIIQSGGDEIYDGIVNFGNPEVMIQLHQNGSVLSDDWWNYSEGGSHTGAANASVLTDSGKTWTVDEWVGYTIVNTTDGSRGIITSNTSTTITATLYGGAENDWDNTDAYLIGAGLNPSAAAGISHRFMIKVRTGGSDIDGRRIRGVCRRFSRTYSEFPVNGTARGNNVLALSDAADLNNATVAGTVSGWSISNTTPGYVAIDVNNDTTDEFFYSEWDRGAQSINDLYEYLKYITSDGYTTTLYGLPGEQFRGITHEIPYSTLSGTFDEGNSISWSGTNSGTGQVLADNGTDTVWIQLLTGVAPANGDSLSQSTPDAASATAGTPVAKPISQPFCGASTGSALIGGYGVGVEYADLSNADLLTALDGNTYQPPNNVTYTVAGLYVDEDQVLVGPWDGSATDAEGNPEVDYNQFTLNGALSGGETTINVNGTIANDTPNTGTIRVFDGTKFVRVTYTGFTTSSFTGCSGTPAASDTANVFISYIDELADTTPVTAGSFSVGVEYKIVTAGTTDFTLIGAADSNVGTIFTASGAGTGTGTAKPTAASVSFTGVYVSNRSLVIKVRDGGDATKLLTPIKEFITSGVFSNANTTVTAIRTSDT